MGATSMAPRFGPDASKDARNVGEDGNQQVKTTGEEFRVRFVKLPKTETILTFRKGFQLHALHLLPRPKTLRLARAMEVA